MTVVLRKELDTDRLERWLIERTQARSKQFPDHNAVFDTFPPRTITVPAGKATDYLGNLWPERFGFAPSPGTQETKIPEVSEEYFEICDIFEAVIDARGSFTMLEWGAGFARWSSLGVAAAKDRKLSPIRIGCVEAHPQHTAYVAENFALMDIGTGNTRLFPFALGGRQDTTHFIIGEPASDLERHDGHTWFGQALAESAHMVEGWHPTSETFEGCRVLMNSDGWRAIEVPIEPASAVLVNYDYVDLIDMDLQGAEADAVDESIALLNDRVRRLHIGTHGRDIEARLRVTLADHGWIKLRDLPSHALSETTFGTVECVDGVQSWFNPRFPPPDYN